MEKKLLDRNQHIKLQKEDQISIRFENVRFKYRTLSKTGLRKVNITIEPGKLTAIVGSSGIGKSTMLNLISKLYPPE